MRCVGLLLLAALAACAQSTNIAAVGLSYKYGDAAPVAGTGLYARQVSQVTNTYAFTVVDAIPAGDPSATVTTNFGAGIAQKVLVIGKAAVYVPTAAGITYTGPNTGWNWSTGALLSIQRKTLRYMPGARLVKSSVSNGTGYQVIVSLLVGWGW